MAIGGFSKSVDESSDIKHDYSCSPCTAQGSQTEAKRFCIDCEEHLCQQCIEHHNKFAKMRTHQIIDKTEMADLGLQQKLSLPTEKCDDHPHNIIDTYCPECDTICCSTCISINHRSCEGVMYLPKAAAGIQKSKAYRNTKSAIPNIHKQLDEIKTEMERDINAITKEEADMLNQIRAFRELLNKKLDKLENKASDVVKYKTKSDKDRVTTNMRILEGMMSKLESSLDKLKKTNSDNESHIFVHFKTGQKIKAEAETLLQKLKVEQERSKLDFRKSKELEELVNNISSIGEIVHFKLIKAPPSGEINVKVKEDMQSCDINYVSQMKDGTILITDYNNDKIKRLTLSYKVRDYCDLPGKPSSFCTTGNDEVAVGLYTQSVQFLSIQNTITLGKSFSVNFQPEGIAFNAGKFYMTSNLPGGLFIYSNTGSLLKTVKQEKSCRPQFAWPKHLIIGTDQTTVMVVDGQDGIVTFDLQGNRMARFSDYDLSGSWGICYGMNGTIFVTGQSSNNIVQFNSKGKTMGVALQKIDGVTSPFSVYWDQVNSRLVITMERNDCIKVFDIE